MRQTLLSMMIGAALIVATLQLIGCNTLPYPGPETQPPLREFKVEEGEQPLFLAEDPIEGFNRRAYKFNYYLDEYFIFPIVRSYEFIVPKYIEDRVSNFIDNVFEFKNLYNNLFQLKFRSAGVTLGRFAINSTVGIAGFWDLATGWGLTRRQEDLGQTFGSYGAPYGAYIVLPFLGPSNVRDTLGLAGDTAISSSVGPNAWVADEAISWSFTAVTAVDKRHRTPFRYQQTGSPFEYELVRMIHTMKREFDIAR